MKRHFFKITSAVFALFILVSLAGCGDDSGSEDNYFIKCTIDGTTYNYTYGFTEEAFGGPAFGNCDPGASPSTFIMAQPGVTAYASGIPADCIFLDFNALTTGTYTTGADFSIYLGGTKIDSTSFTLNVDQYEAVGGVISGTFSGVISNAASGAMPVTDGSFNVLRIADNTLVP